jgi:hypothetical protein
MANLQGHSILFYKAPSIASIPTFTETNSTNQLRTVSRIITEAEFATLMTIGSYTDTTILIDVGDLIITTDIEGGTQTAIYTAIFNPTQATKYYVQTWSINGPLGTLLTPSEVS